MDRSAEFRRWKAQCLSKADLSRKGSVDEDVVELVHLLNEREQFFTTSSCAGRIILLDGVSLLCAFPAPALYATPGALCPPIAKPQTSLFVFVLLVGGLGFLMKLRE